MDRGGLGAGGEDEEGQELPCSVHHPAGGRGDEVLYLNVFMDSVTCF